MKNLSARIILPALLACLLVHIIPASAQSAYWDPLGTNASPGSGGSGNWDSGTSVWWISGNSDAIFPSGGTAFFEGTNGTVSLNDTETVDGLTFTTGGYTISGGGTLSLNSNPTTITVPSGTNPTTISATIAGSVGLSVSGASPLILSGANNTYSGGTTVSAGSTVQINALKSAGTGTVTLNGNAIFVVASSATGNGVPNTFAGGSNSAIEVHENVNTYFTGTTAWSGFSGTIYCYSNPANGGFIAEASGPLGVSSNATWNLAAGATLDLNKGGYSNAASVIINGTGSAGNFGALRMDGITQSGNVLLAGSGLANQIGCAGGTGGVNILSGIISDGGAGNGFTRAGVTNGSYYDTIVLSGENTYSGGTFLNVAILRMGSAENPGVSGPLGKSPASNPGNIIFNSSILNAGVLQYSSVNQFDYSGRFSTNANQAFNIDVNGQTVTFASPLSSTGGSFSLRDATGGGTLIMNGENTYTGTSALSNGTLRAGCAEIPGTSGPLGASAASNPGSILLYGGYLQFSSANQNDYSGRFSTAINQDYYIDVNGQTVTFAAPLTSTGGKLTLKDSTGGGKLVLSGAETYSGVTTVTSGTMDVSSTGSLSGNVAVNGGTLEFDNASAMSSNNTLMVASGATLNLNFTGTLKVGPMYFSGILQSFGTWGAPGSGAANTSAAITGSGKLNVEPLNFPHSYYDPNGLDASPGSGGSGNWDAVTSNWWVSGTSDTEWTSNNIANFEGSAGTVSLNDNESANGLTFTVDGYTLEGGGILTLNGSTPTINIPAATNGGTTISAVLAGATEVSVDGAGGVLTLSGNNTYSAGTSVSPNTALEITSAAGAGTGSVALSGNANFIINIVGAGSVATSVTGGTNSVITIAENGNNTFLTGSLAGFSGTVMCSNASGYGAVVVENPNPLTIPSNGTWNIAAGATLDLNAGGVDAASVIINGNGSGANYGALRADGVTQTGNVLLAASGPDNEIGSASPTGGISTISGIISDGGQTNGLTRVGYGNAGYVDTIVLSGENTYSGATTLNFGILRVASTENPGVSGPLGNSPASNPGNIIFNNVGTVNGGILQFSSANHFDYSGRFSTGGNQAFNIDVNGQTVTFATPLTSPSGTLTLSDTVGGGKLILPVAEAFNGGVTVNGGTLDVSSGSIESNATVTVNGGTLELDNNSSITNVTLTVASPGTVNLNYSGIQAISALFINGNQQTNGVYGAAAMNPGNVFKGSGTLAVGFIPITISSAAITNNQFTVSWTSLVGTNYNVYTSTNLTQPWTLVTSTPITASGPTTTFSLPGNTSTNKALFVLIGE